MDYKKVLLTSIAMLSLIPKAFSLSPLGTGLFEFNKYGHIDLNKTFKGSEYHVNCSYDHMLKLSPGNNKIINVGCLSSKKKSNNKNSTPLLMLDIRQKKYQLFGNAPTRFVDWHSNNSLIFYGPSSTPNEAPKVEIVNFETGKVDTIKLSTSLNSSVRNCSEGVDNINFIYPYLYVSEKSPMRCNLEANRFAVNVNNVDELVEIIDLQETGCLKGCQFDTNYLFDASLKKITLFPSYRTPHRSSSYRDDRMPNYLNTALSDIQGSLGIEGMHGIIYLWNKSSKFKEQNIDGWETLNLYKGERDSVKDISATAYLGDSSEELLVSVEVTDDVLLSHEGGRGKQDYVDIWLHTQLGEASLPSKGDGTFHFRLFPISNLIVFLDKGHYPMKLSDEEVSKVTSLIRMTSIATKTGYSVKAYIPYKAFNPKNRTLWYQINVIDVDESEEEAIMSSNTNLRKYYWSDLTTFNRARLVF